jgi:hypothetical protein
VRPWQYATLTFVARNMPWTWRHLPADWRATWAVISFAMLVRSLHVAQVAQAERVPGWVPCYRCGGGPCELWDTELAGAPLH